MTRSPLLSQPADKRALPHHQFQLVTLLYSATPSAACSATFAAGEITSGGVGQAALKLARRESPGLMSQSPEIEF